MKIPITHNPHFVNPPPRHSKNDLNQSSFALDGMTGACSIVKGPEFAGHIRLQAVQILQFIELILTK